MMKANLETENGFTLIEVCIAVSILAIGIFAVASMQVSAIWGNDFAGRQTEGTTIALDRMEKLISRSYDDADLSVGNHTDTSPPNGYTVVWNVTNDTPLNNAKRLIVNVKWSDRGGLRAISVERIVPRIS